MADKKLVGKLEKYLEENFIVLVTESIYIDGAKFSIGTPKETPPDKYDGVIGAMRWKIDEIFDRLELEGTFGQRIRDLIDEKGMTEVEVYKKAQLDRRIFSKLLCYRNYTPSKRTLFAIALALELSLDEALKLFGEAGYTFSKYDKQDLIIKFCFDNKVYNLFTVNELLNHYGFNPLGDSIL